MTNVVNPSPVPIRLRSATAGAYLALNRALREAADQAERVAAAFATPDGPTADLTAAQQQGAADWRAVRDALRNAATEALVPRGGTGRPRCRRCSIDCPYCSPPPAAGDRAARIDAYAVTITGHEPGHDCLGCAHARSVAAEIEGN